MTIISREDIQSHSQSQPMTESRFNMWRAIFALAHADNKITLEERQFMQDVLSREPFTQEQKDTLRADIREAQDINALFGKITDQTDRTAFFYFARMLCWCDGDFDAQEQNIVMHLSEQNLRQTDIDSMVGHVDLELDEEKKGWLEEDMRDAKSEDHEMSGFMNAFIRRFNSRRGKR